MQMIRTTTPSIALLLEVFADRVLYPAMIALCLGLSAYVASATLYNPFIL